jgi:hypothetical protein
MFDVSSPTPLSTTFSAHREEYGPMLHQRQESGGFDVCGVEEVYLHPHILVVAPF